MLVFTSKYYIHTTNGNNLLVNVQYAYMASLMIGNILHVCTVLEELTNCFDHTVIFSVFRRLWLLWKTKCLIDPLTVIHSSLLLLWCGSFANNILYNAISCHRHDKVVNKSVKMENERKEWLISLDRFPVSIYEN